MRIPGKVLSFVLIGVLLAALFGIAGVFFYNMLAFIFSPSIWPWNLFFIGAIAALYYVSWRRGRSSR